MKDQTINKLSLYSSPEIKYILQSLSTKTIHSFSHQKHVSQIIKHALQYREEKGLIFATTNDHKQYIPQLWQHFFADSGRQNTQIYHQNQTQLTQQDPQQNQVYPQKSTNQIILQAAISRQHSILDELKDNLLKIQIKPKYKIIQKPSDQTTKNKQNKQLNQSKASANSQNDFIQFIKNQKLSKDKRKKLFQSQHQKELQKLKKLHQDQQNLRQVQQAKIRQEKRIKQQEIAQKRHTQKQLIKRHQSAYSDFQNKIYHSTQKQQPMNQFHRYESEQLIKIKQEKQKLYKSFEKQKIDQHQKVYLDFVHKKNQERYKRMEDIKEIEGIQNQKSRIRFKSSFKFEKPQQEYEKRKKQEYLQAKQKRDRILSYKQKVKSDFVPQVDQQKKNQLLKLMQDLEFSRKGQYRKKVLKDGEVVIEKIDLRDARQMGLNYLQQIKKEVAKMRAMKRENNDQFMEATPQQDQKAKKPIDYLKQIRQSKSKSTSGFMSGRKTFGNTKSSEMSFEQKLKKVQEMTTKLMEKTKQQEMLLKYGKFKTSQQILIKKQIIDRNYIDLLNMKLEMIENE